MEIVVILLVAAVIGFALDAARVQSSISWTPLAWAFVIASAIAYLYETTEVF